MICMLHVTNIYTDIVETMALTLTGQQKANICSNISDKSHNIKVQTASVKIDILT